MRSSVKSCFVFFQRNARSVEPTLLVTHSITMENLQFISALTPLIKYICACTKIPMS